MAKFDTRELYAFDARIEQAVGGSIVGLDEVGRGPLAGPVVAAAVVLDPARPIDGVFDSKQVPAKRREALYVRITGEAASWALGQASVEEIEERNILQASLLAMRRALDKIQVPWSLALVDGNQPMHGLAAGAQRTVIRGDAASASIAAASILAKVSRDRMMAAYDGECPGYGFGLHKGYGTAHHIDRIRNLGLCRIHRRSFCAHLLGQTEMDLTPACVSAQPHEEIA
jgi:ribonuclease HII